MLMCETAGSFYSHSRRQRGKNH